MVQECKSQVEAVAAIESGQRIFVHGGAATPNALLRALETRAPVLHDVEFIHLHTEGPATYATSKFQKSFRVANLFVGANIRNQLDGDRVDYLPCFLSEVPALFRSRRRPIDIALVHVSPPDAHGFCSLGTNVDVARAAVDSARILIAQVNPNMPKVHGDGFVPFSELDYVVYVDDPLPNGHCPTLGPVDLAIGKHVAGLVEDGACIQVGIGSVPDAVARALEHHRHLGLHTEMWSDGILSLIESGAMDHSLKKIHRGRAVSGFLLGSKRLYDFVNDNPSVVQLGIDYVNNPTIIARNPRVTAINSAVEVDLTGQVCADSVGPRIVSGVGGQMDFMRGAALSAGGKPIIALSSRTKSGKPRIVSSLQVGAGVVTTRAHVHYVVTEYGVADLYGKTLSERARALIAVAHPEDRDSLKFSLA